MLGFGAYRWLSGDKHSDEDAQQTRQQQNSAPGATAPPDMGCMMRTCILKLLLKMVQHVLLYYVAVSCSLRRPSANPKPESEPAGCQAPLLVAANKSRSSTLRTAVCSCSV